MTDQPANEQVQRGAKPVQIYKKKSVNIIGVEARMFVRATNIHETSGPTGHKRMPFDITSEFRTVKDAHAAAVEAGSPADEHHCPFCDDYYSWEVFKAHMPDCIRLHHAGRQHIWTPPGFSKYAKQNYDRPVKITGGL